MSRVGDRADTLISPELQAEVIESYAAQRGLALEMLPPELDVSGGKARRPILDQAIEQIRSGAATGLIVDTLDRFSRISLFEALGVIRDIEAEGGQVIAVAENFDARTPDGRMQRNFYLSIGEWQRERYGGKIAASKRLAVQRGIWPMPVIPVGYRRDDSRHLDPDPEWAPRVVEAFETRAAGRPWRVVADQLDRGLSGAQKVLRNRVYLGEIRLRVGGDLVVNRDAHPLIVERRLWEAAQGRHPRPPRRSASGPPALLAGLARCAGCQGALTRSTVKRWSAYRCLSRRAGGSCPERAIATERLLDEHVQAVLLPHLAELRARSFERAAETSGLEQRLVEAEEEFEAFQAALSAADLGVERAAKALKERAAVVDSLRAELASTRANAGAGVLERDVGEIWPELSVEERGQVLRSALGVVWVWKGKAALDQRTKVIAAGFEPPDLPRPGRKRFGIAGVEWTDDLAPGELRLPAREDPGEG